MRWVTSCAHWTDRTERRRVLVELVLGLSAIGAVTTFGLFLENCVNSAAGTQSWALTLFWAGLLAVSLAGSTFSYLVTRELRDAAAGRGTVYYVRWLPSSLSDWYLEEVSKPDEDSPRRPLDRKIIAVTPAYRPGMKHHDAVAELDALYARLETAMNNDDQTTAFRLTPNLLWPGSLRLGSDLTARLDPELEEVESAETEGGQPPDDPGGCEAAVTWCLPRRAPQPTGLPVVAARQEGDAVEGTVRSVLLMVDFSRQGPCTRPLGRAFDKVVRVGLWVDSGGEPATVRVRHRMPDRPHTASESSSASENPMSEHVPVVSPVESTQVFAEALRTQLHDHSDATIYLVARVPKSVGVAMGYRLVSMAGTSRNSRAHPGCGSDNCYQESCVNPWSRIVGLSWVGNDYVITRVHPSQPPLNEMIEKWDRLAQESPVDGPGD